MQKNILLAIILIVLVGILGLQYFLSGRSASSIPPRPAFQSSDTCIWKWEGGLYVGFWREECTFATGFWTVAEQDEATYAVVVTDEEGTYAYDTALHVFLKDGTAGIESILPQLESSAILPEGAECSFIPRAQAGGKSEYTLEPFGKTKEMFDAQSKLDEVPADPCGAYGIGQADRRFVIFDADPTKVIYINNGQDGSFFDENSIQTYNK